MAKAKSPRSQSPRSHHPGSSSKQTGFAPLPPLPYPVRESQRAKHVSIRISVQGQVEIVTPIGFDRRKLPEIIQRKQTWITKTLEKIEVKRQSLDRDRDVILPDRLFLRSCGEDWQISYQESSDPWVRCHVLAPLHLRVQGQIDLPSCHSALRQWVHTQAEQRLPLWLRQVSTEIALPCQKITIRRQKTIWASCSEQKNISLNYKLLLLPPELVRYVFIHELCHTVHMNHSSDFWALVSHYDPGYPAHDRELNQAWRYAPDWLNER